MCPVAVSISAPPVMEKRSDEISLTTESEISQSSSQQLVEENK
jgi:hypothetical protein